MREFRWSEVCLTCHAPILLECPNCESRAWVKGSGPEIQCASCGFEWACAGCMGLRPPGGSWDENDGVPVT